MLWEVIEKNKRNSKIALIVMAVWYVFIYGTIFACVLCYCFAPPGVPKSLQADLIRIGCYLFGIIAALFIFTGIFLSSKNTPFKMSGCSNYKIGEHTHIVLKNIADEISIAAGLKKAPDIYILDSNIPNAYACGYDIEKSSIVISKGLAALLSRDELQCVIAHEISHIANKDTMYITCSGILYNIFFKITEWLTKNKDKKEEVEKFKLMFLYINIVLIAVIAFIGFSASGFLPFGLYFLIIIDLTLLFPFIFLFFLGLISRLGLIVCRFLLHIISKEREYLADACAVLYTRNPEALASAMNKIEWASKNNIYRKEAEKANPLIQASFFAPVKGDKTHPETKSRIQILEALKSADLNEYEKIYEKLKGKSLLPKSALKDNAKIDIIPSDAQKAGGEFNEAVYSACTPNSILNDEKEIKTIKENKELLNKNIKKYREAENIVQTLAGYTIINCNCGTKLKIPPVYKYEIIICPHCGRKHTV